MTDHATLRRMCAAQADIPSALVLELLDQYQDVRDAVRRGALCPMCSTGMTRQTVGMVCQLCGTDYARSEYASMRRDSAHASKAVLSDALTVRAERDALAAKVERVRSLHAKASREMHYCLGCDEESSVFQTPWPCPTIRALDGPQS